MKTCCTCKELKPFSDFNKKTSAKDGMQHKCRACSNKMSKNHYLADKGYYVKKAKKLRHRRRKWIQSLKDLPCADCKGVFPAVCMDFDHVDGEKVGHVSRLIVEASMATVLEEIEKCEVVCANCHRIRTHSRR